MATAVDDDRPADGEARVDGGGDGVPGRAGSPTPRRRFPARPGPTSRSAPAGPRRRPAAFPPNLEHPGRGIGQAAEVENLLAGWRLIVTIHDPLIGVVLAPGQPD